MPHRDVRFCVLDAQPAQDLALIRSSFERLKKQSFGDWVAVYYVDELTEEMLTYAAQQNKAAEQNKEVQKVVLARTSGSLGRNY